MTLEQLRIFVAVAEREHMTAAARALHVTQSAASAAIAALEERHAIKLFHRVGRGIALTEAGRLFLAEARGVLARAETAEMVLSDLGGLARGTLRVVASQTIAAYWLPPLLATFQARHPAIDIGDVHDLDIDVESDLSDEVRQGGALGASLWPEYLLRVAYAAPGQCGGTARVENDARHDHRSERWAAAGFVDAEGRLA